MSSVVTEASPSVSSQHARAKSGQQGNTSAGDNGFSELVDNNLSAADASEAAPQGGRQQSPGQEPSAKPQTGVRRQSQAEQTHAASNEPADQSETDVREEPAGTSETDAVVRTGVVTADAAPDLIDAVPDNETDDAQSAASTMPPVPVTGIAAAVAVQIELAAGADATRVIDTSDALVVTNPAATIVSGPAETAANALARVALDTADAGTAASTESPQTQAETDTPTPTTANGATPATQANTPSTTDANAEAAAETPVTVETAAPDAQLAVKAQAELTATAKSDPAVDEAQVNQLIASTETKLTQPHDDVQATSESPVPAQKPESNTDRRIEADARVDEQSRRPAESEGRPTHRASHEPTLSAQAQAATAAVDQSQPTGFGVSQAATLHMSNVAVAQLSAMPVQANVPIPVSALAVEITANAQIGRSRFEIRLDPPELGRIDVRLDVDRQGQVTSHLIVEKSATLDLLRRDAQQLERALQDAGLKTSDNGLQFSLRDQGQHTGRNDDSGSGRQNQRLMIAEEETIVAETAGRSYGRMIGQRGGIDIRV